MDNKKQKPMLVNKGMSRRDFMVTAVAAGVTASAAATMWSDQVFANTPKKGGRLRIGAAGGSTTDSLDTATLPGFQAQQISFGQLRNCLVEVGADGVPKGELATEWSSSPEANVWTFKLRQGVEFHNGKTMGAADVVHSINHHRGKDSKSAAKGIVDPITDVKADGDTVVFTLREGNADFPFLMSDYHLGVVPEGTTGKEMEKGMGTGGYILASHEPGVRALSKRNPNYWKEGHANFDEIESIAINDVNARTNALKSGQIDAMNRCEGKTFNLLARIQGIETLKTTGTKHYTIPMRCDTDPFKNNDLRLALKYAIDREAVVKTVLRGHGLVANDHPISPSNRYFNKDLAVRGYDPDKARHHFKKAGMDGQSIKLHAANAAFGGAVDTAVLYKEHAAKAGINIDVVREPDDGYWSNVWLKKSWCFSFWSGRPTEDWMFSIAYAKGAKWNESFWDHDRFNMLLKAGRAELDPAKRAEIYAEMQVICHTDGGSVIPMYASDLQAVSTKIGHNTIAANWELDGLKGAERWWMK